MTIYKQRADYRKIWSSHHGPIPKDENNRSYEIHHIDGDRKNNNISNLQCVSIQRHYDIHYEQKDWAACLKIAARAKMDPATKSNLARLNALNQIENGTWPLSNQDVIDRKLSTINQKIVDGTFHLLSGEIQRKSANERLQEGTHHITTKEHRTKQIDGQKRLLAEGTHKLQGPTNNANLLATDRHPSQIKACCCKCHKEMPINAFNMHVDSCVDNLPYMSNSSGLHSSQIKFSCLCCKKAMAITVYTRHIKNCFNLLSK